MSVFPSPARWLADGTPTLHRLIVTRALLDLGLTEMPPGSNRSPAIDAYLSMVDAPVGQPWCAAAVSAWYRAAGARIPPTDAAACESWRQWALTSGTLNQTPVPGAAVLYGLDHTRPTHADHMGVVVRVDPILLAVEGNTVYARQRGLQREGIGCELAAVATTCVIGYVSPSAA